MTLNSTQDPLINTMREEAGQRRARIDDIVRLSTKKGPFHYTLFTCQEEGLAALYSTKEKGHDKEDGIFGLPGTLMLIS
jgi:hypothetical protein